MLPQIFYLLEHLLLPYLVILKQRCNNIISTLIKLYMLRICVCAFSLYRESLDQSWGDRPLISEVVLSQQHLSHRPWGRGLGCQSSRWWTQGSQSEQFHWERSHCMSGTLHRGRRWAWTSEPSIHLEESTLQIPLPRAPTVSVFCTGK
jgi:hypothetical protein